MLADLRSIPCGRVEAGSGRWRRGGCSRGLFYSTSDLMYALRLEMNPIVNSSVQSVLYRAGKLPSWLPRISMARSTIPLTGATSAAHWLSKQAAITASWNSRFIPVISNVALVARSYLVMSSTSSLMALWRPLISQQLLHWRDTFFQIKIGSVTGCTRGSGFSSKRCSHIYRPSSIG